MSTLLHLDSSGKGPLSVTRPLTQYFADKWKATTGSASVIDRDLMTSEIPFVDAEIIGAFYTPPDKLTPQQNKILEESDTLINELFTAETYVFGVPMYNFSVPAVFKAYIDLVVRAGKTFTFGGGSPKGLLQDKRLIVVTASGADYSEPPMKGLDFVEPYVRTIFGFLGVSNVEFVSVAGRDPETIAAQSKRAKEHMDLFLASAINATVK
jgi:FMN-dependent NADH-azoreductase